MVLREMTKVLQNKSLILSKNGNNELDLLVDVLCAMVSNAPLEILQRSSIKNVFCRSQIGA